MIEPEGAQAEEPEPSPEELSVLRVESDFDAPPIVRKVEKKTPEQVRRTYLPDVHRLLPQSPDAEKGVLSSILLAPRDVCGMCVEKRITREHFFIPQHADIYSTLLELWDANKPIDFITLTQVLRDAGRLDQCGGAAFVTELFTFLPTAANAAYYMDILEEKYVCRNVILVGTEYASRGYEEQHDVPKLLDEFEEKTLAIRDKGAKSDIVFPKQAVVEAISAIEELYNRRGEITGLSTGFSDIDKLTDGLHPAEMIVIAARPSQGKTAIAMNMAEYIAVELKKPIVVFSLEMSRQQLWQRLLCSRAHVNLARVREGFLSDRDFPALQTAASKLAESNLLVDDASALSIQEIRARARRFKQQFGIQAVFVDYLQLVSSTTKRAQENREREVAEVSGGLKALSKELGLPVVVLAQISRQFETRGVNARPRLSDLRESGSIEQDADTVAFIVRPETNTDLTEEERKECEGRAEFIVAKQRHGPVGDIRLTFLKEFTRFCTRARERDSEAEQDGSLGI